MSTIINRMSTFEKLYYRSAICMSGIGMFYGMWKGYNYANVNNYNKPIRGVFSVTFGLLGITGGFLYPVTGTCYMTFRNRSF